MSKEKLYKLFEYLDGFMDKGPTWESVKKKADEKGFSADNTANKMICTKEEFIRGLEFFGVRSLFEDEKLDQYLEIFNAA